MTAKGIKHESVRSLLAKGRQVEWALVVALLLVAISVWGFVEIADEVTEGDSATFDRQVLLALRTSGDLSDPIGPRWFEELVRDITALGSVGVLLGVVAASCGFLWLEGNHRAVGYVLLAVLGALLLSVSLKAFYDRARPDLVPHGDYVYTRSFPSGHSMMSAATYLTLGVLLAKYQRKKALRVYLVLIAILIALAVGTSRVYLSVHWPTDVLAGWALGAAWAIFCWVMVTYFAPEKTPADEDAEAHE